MPPVREKCDARAEDLRVTPGALLLREEWRNGVYRDVRSRRLVGGCESREGSLSLIRTGLAELPPFTVTTAGGDRIRPRHSAADRIEYRVPADSRIMLAW